jgi:predicted kinase
LLVVVTGPPATGKTTLARPLASELGIPLVSRDDIKELLFDEIGTGDREWSSRLGRASYALLFYWLEIELASGRSLVTETNFDVPSVPHFAALPPHRVFQIHCSAPAQVILERYEQRPRHAGHVDTEVAEELRRGEHEGRFGPLPLDGPIVTLDTSGEVAPLDELAARIRSLLG